MSPFRPIIEAAASAQGGKGSRGCSAGAELVGSISAGSAGRCALTSELAPVADGVLDDTRDFDALARLHWSRVFRFILASIRDKDAAASLTQDCFFRAYRAREQFRGASSIGTWLMQIAANLVRDHEGSRRLNFWRRVFRSSVDVNLAGDWIADRHRLSPEAEASVREQVEAIWSVVGHLSERQRTVFLLRFVEDMELAEIAAVTGMKEGTVKVHLFRALRAVRSGLGVKS
jgi:RNA polymerase sigma-70 factor (ECF subfamily)